MRLIGGFDVAGLAGLLQALVALQGPLDFAAHALDFAGVELDAVERAALAVEDILEEDAVGRVLRVPLAHTVERRAGEDAGLRRPLLAAQRSAQHHFAGDRHGRNRLVEVDHTDALVLFGAEAGV